MKSLFFAFLLTAFPFSAHAAAYEVAFTDFDTFGSCTGRADSKLIRKKDMSRLLKVRKEAFFPKDLILTLPQKEASMAEEAKQVSEALSWLKKEIQTLAPLRSKKWKEARGEMVKHISWHEKKFEAAVDYLKTGDARSLRLPGMSEKCETMIEALGDEKALGPYATAFGEAYCEKTGNKSPSCKRSFTFDERSSRQEIFKVKKQMLIFGWEDCLDYRERQKIWEDEEEQLFQSMLTNVKCEVEDSCPED